ncbi:P-loop containing nucleoside triphosphate hydrolase protein [Glomus cerebriforme]|uniref:P-loop containing nucleoside triphosphate hydrolase protein n=1 Tax=Glomus cerebriforme TaxID=658196 RepID=A0A397T1I4_9GLOM|nr:P-loop containing nucleoside triphosphate hydrolase protein [Glomus cerebriforme]
MGNKFEAPWGKPQSTSSNSTFHSTSSQTSQAYQGGSSSSDTNGEYATVIEGLKKIYNNKIKQLETTYNFEGFHSPPLTDSDIEAKPIVLLMGQYSTGKTTFIKYLLEREYPGSHIGVEPTTDRFVAVMNGVEDRVIPGNAAAVNAQLPFRGLNKFGQAFLSRFQVSQLPSPALENMTIIDTPGILAGDKQRIDRGYDFTAVIEYFAERADLILLLFDSHKLDISNEFKMAIHSLRGQEEKVRVLLNKSDMVDGQQLMRVYGALMWSLGKVVQTPEVMRVFLGSFWSEKPPNVFEDCRALIEAEQKDLLNSLRELPRNTTVRKINEIVKRARLAKVHAYIIGHLKKEMPAMFGKQSKQNELINRLDKEFTTIRHRHQLPPGDFPNVERFKQGLRTYKFEKFNSLKLNILERAEDALANDLPKLMAKFPQGNRMLSPTERNPFESTESSFSDLPPSYWEFSSVDKASVMSQFNALHPVNGKVPGSSVKPVLMETGLSNDILAKVWRLADWDNDGYMDADQFAVAMHLCKGVLSGGELPDELPKSMIPNRKV